MSVNLFSVLDVFENHYFISATKWVCVCVCVGVCVCVSMRAVYLVLLNLSFLRMSVCLCLYAYCLLSIFKPFISACVCVCVCDRERDSYFQCFFFNEFSIVNVFNCQPCISHWPTRGLQPCSWRYRATDFSSNPNQTHLNQLITVFKATCSFQTGVLEQGCNWNLQDDSSPGAGLEIPDINS